jgi:hypothetical protein
VTGKDDAYIGRGKAVLTARAHEKIDARIAWLEQKMVEVLWLLISVSSMIVGGVIAWFASELLETRSLWLLAPVAITAWLLAGWLLQRNTFRGAPPHIDFLGP